jgi:hypothetical protein
LYENGCCTYHILVPHLLLQVPAAGVAKRSLDSLEQLARYLDSVVPTCTCRYCGTLPCRAQLLTQVPHSVGYVRLLNAENLGWECHICAAVFSLLHILARNPSIPLIMHVLHVLRCLTYLHIISKYSPENINSTFPARTP